MPTILSHQTLCNLYKNSSIIGLKYFDTSHIGPASIDITAEDEIYEIDRMIQPLDWYDETIRDLLPNMGARRIDRNSILKVGKYYLAKASVDLDIDSDYYATFNAKSSSGRNFIFCRIIADKIHTFDYINNQNKVYKGELWVLILPLAFDIIIDDERLVQMRLGKLDKSQIIHKSSDILTKRSSEVNENINIETHDNSIITTAYIQPGKIIGYKCLNNSSPISLSNRNLDHRSYFEPIYAKVSLEKEKEIYYIELAANNYYLLATNEVLNIPDNISSELLAIDTKLGLYFSHFAGFFDPGFVGTATLEIMSPYDIIIRHKQPIGKFIFEKLDEITDKVYSSPNSGTGNYQGQMEVKLPKQFY